MIDGELARKHLDRRLARLQPTTEFARPPRGWIRAIRDALGMTAAQLARRLGVSQPRVIAMEKAEQRGAITLTSLSNAAEALDCTLVYAMVPNRTLDAVVRERAIDVATEHLARIDHSMRLENQGLEAEDLLAERKRLTAELLRGNLHRLWDKP
jgi:predicted DNA-binding mobile mystery protein A